MAAEPNGQRIARRTGPASCAGFAGQHQRIKKGSPRPAERLERRHYGRDSEPTTPPGGNVSLFPEIASTPEPDRKRPGYTQQHGRTKTDYREAV
jgi:hypothetical protein